MTTAGRLPRRRRRPEDEHLPADAPMSIAVAPEVLEGDWEPVPVEGETPEDRELRSKLLASVLAIVRKA